jgi:hypothetical protein
MKEAVVISVQFSTAQSPATLSSFQFVSDTDLLRQFTGKTVSDIQITEATSQGMDPIVLRLKISFTDGSFLEVDRKSTRLADSERKIVHLDLAYQAK